MIIKPITDETFKSYGRILTAQYNVEELIEGLKTKEAPTDAVIYVPSDEALESLAIGKTITDSFFGGLPTQIGYCNGTNNKLNAVEYHRCSRLGVAGTNLILLRGKQKDISADFTYATNLIEAFFVPEGEVFEMYATTLHYAPCSVEGKPFRNIVALPKDTNTSITVTLGDTVEDKLMTAKNKWLIAHAEAGIEGAFVGLKGENITL